MIPLVIGIDPDTVQHGVAIFRGGALSELKGFTLMELMEFLSKERTNHSLAIAMENVKAHNFVYNRNATESKKTFGEIALRVGRCQQAQTEVERMLEHLGVAYTLYDPGGNNWAHNRPLFERITGWAGRSNEDTRSAAFFGFLLQDDLKRKPA